ncbi:hypothetical protein AB0N05_19610 [Nocardia sp. NPDC051030]|uniref:hypothetical protein n=1 Tax=Nocardia sp. NPDC051030 TaxID=3155162 RepID=UPI00342CED98
MSDDAAQSKKIEEEAVEAVPTGGEAGKADAVKADAADAETTKIDMAKADSDAADSDKVETVKVPVEPKGDAPKPEKTPEKAKESKDSKAPALAGGMPLIPLLAAFAAGVLVVAAVATAVVLWMKSSDNEKELDARDGATAAACDFGKAVSNYDAANLDDYFNRVNALSTGQWGQFFSGASGALKDAMNQVKAKSTLDEIHCAWESGDDNKAKVIVILTQVRSNALNAQPDMLTVPGVAEVEKTDGKWKISNFDSPAMKGLTGTGTGQQPANPAPTTEAPKPGN